jgi:cardiolipin synthase
VRPEPIFTVPNALTLVRLPLAAAVWIAPERPLWLVAVLVAAGLSDVLDGRIARAIRRRRIARGRDPGVAGQAQAMGAWLDPLCDKLFVVSALTAVAIFYQPPWLVVLLAATRELFLVPFALAYWRARRLRHRLRFDFRAGRLGKATTAVQFATVAAILFWPPAALPLAIGASAVGFLAAIRYLSRALVTLRAAARNRIAWQRWLEIRDHVGR